jgi:FkbM family methyltransferase
MSEGTRSAVIRDAFADLGESAADDLRDDFNMVGTAYSLRKLRSRGFEPKVVVDIGAYVGGWTRMVKTVFPNCNVLMVEAQPEKERVLREVEEQYAGSVQTALQLLGPEEARDVLFHTMDMGSSVFEEHSNYPRKPTFLPMCTLDRLLEEEKLERPELLKVDVQGYELEVLKGGKHALSNAQVVILEVALLNYNESAPLVHEVLGFMAERGFVLYDIGEIIKSHAHLAVIQVDAIFIREDSRWRPAHFDFNETRVKASVHAEW